MTLSFVKVFLIFGFIMSQFECFFMCRYVSLSNNYFHLQTHTHRPKTHKYLISALFHLYLLFCDIRRVSIFMWSWPKWRYTADSRVFTMQSIKLKQIWNIWQPCFILTPINRKCMIENSYASVTKTPAATNWSGCLVSDPDQGFLKTYQLLF